MPFPFRRKEVKLNVKIGTTSPIHIPRTEEAVPVNPGEYYWIKVHSSQVAYRGSPFERAKGLVVTSKINLHHQLLGEEEIYAIQRSREVELGTAEQLGLSSSLVSLVPATMPRVTVVIEFLLDTENSLAKLGNVINGDGFMAALSLAPGVAAVAKTIGGLAKDMITAFVPAEERKPILQFAGDFMLGGGASTDTLRDGYYAILGTRDDENPLPGSLSELSIAPSALLVEGQDVTQWSYVVLEVTRLPARTREMSAGAPWDTKLIEADSTLRDKVEDPLASEEEIEAAWGKCKALLQEARTLLLADANYTTREANDICRAVYKECADLLSGGAKAFAADTKADRGTLGIAPDEDLAAQVATYKAQAADARQILVENEML